jgi:hypothetical protein
MDNENFSPYQHGSFYEIFMLRAFRSSDNSKPGMHGSTMEYLMRVENGDNSWVKYHGSLSKQLAKLQQYMTKALDKYMLMKKLPSPTIRILSTYKTDVANATYSEELMRIVYYTLDITQEVK